MKICLSTPFLYQNPTTGAASSTTLSCTQLCRLLCPAASDAAKRAATTSIVSPSSRILAFDAVAQSYDAAGWQLANSVDVLSEACDEWYYEACANNNDNGNNIEGPISARALSKLYYQHDSSVTGATRVYRNSSSAQQQSKQAAWMQIDQVDNLKLAIEAFRDVVGMPSSASWTVNDQTAKDANHTNDNNVGQMTFDNGQESNNGDDDQTALQEQNVADELEAFLSSTDHLAQQTNKNATEENQEEYESDGGTRYIRDHQTGNWIHEALMMQQRGESHNNANNNNNGSNGQANDDSDNTNNNNKEAATKKRKRKKPKFSAKSARNWIYITGLPLDTTEEELSTYFSKVGIIDIDPETLKPKIKLYRHKNQPCSSNSGQEDNQSKDSGEVGQLKGDASICYARPESVELALQILDENLFRDGAILSVQRAKFEQHGSTFDADKAGKGGVGKRRIISESKRRVARLAAIQAVGWDESENGRIAGGLKGLRIIVLMNMFDPRELDRDDDVANEKRLQQLERDIHSECEKSGTVEKITIFSKHPAGVAIVKFIKPNDASDAVKSLNGKVRADGKRIEASFWDGTTDYTVVDTEREEKEDAKRLDQFGDWLEEQDLPEEFQLRVEGS